MIKSQGDSPFSGVAPILDGFPGLVDLAQSFAAFTDGSPLPMALVRASGHLVVDLNAGFCSLLGRAKVDIVGRPFAEAMVPYDGDWLAMMDRVFATGQPDIHPSGIRVEGFLPALSASMWPVAAGGKPFGVIVQIIESASAGGRLVAMNEALIFSSIRQHELAETAERARMEALAAGQVKDHFLAVLSHELRTPLSPVLIGLSMLLRRKDLPPTVGDSLAMITRNVKIEVQMIDQILDFTSLGRGKVEFGREPVDLREVLRHAAEIVAPDVALKQQDVTLALEAVGPVVLGDGLRLRQVFWNLLRNASKFTPARGAIRLAMRTLPATPEASGCVVVEVSDSGIGFEPESRERIFEAFTQANQAVAREHGGLGLGLAIAKTIVDAHGGTLYAQSIGSGQGSTFTVNLPLGAP